MSTSSMDRAVMPVGGLASPGLACVVCYLVRPPGAGPARRSRRRRRSGPPADRSWSGSLTVLEKNPRRGTALDKIYGFHVENGSLEPVRQDVLRDRDGEGPQGRHRLDDPGPGRIRSGAAMPPPSRPLPRRPQLRQDRLAGRLSTWASRWCSSASRTRPRKPSRKPSPASRRRPICWRSFRPWDACISGPSAPEEALAVWTRLEKLFPNDARVQEQIAATLVEEGQPAQALPRYEALAKLTNDDYRQYGLSHRSGRAEGQAQPGQRRHRRPGEAAGEAQSRQLAASAKFAARSRRSSCGPTIRTAWRSTTRAGWRRTRRTSMRWPAWPACWPGRPACPRPRCGSTRPSSSPPRGRSCGWRSSSSSSMTSAFPKRSSSTSPRQGRSEQPRLPPRLGQADPPRHFAAQRGAAGRSRAGLAAAARGPAEGSAGGDAGRRSVSPCRACTEAGAGAV